MNKLNFEQGGEKNEELDHDREMGEPAAAAQSETKTEDILELATDPAAEAVAIDSDEADPSEQEEDESLS